MTRAACPQTTKPRCGTLREGRLSHLIPCGPNRKKLPAGNSKFLAIALPFLPQKWQLHG